MLHETRGCDPVLSPGSRLRIPADQFFDSNGVRIRYVDRGSRDVVVRRPCAVNLSHVRTVNQSRLADRLGKLEDEYLPKIEQALLISLGFR